MPVTEFLLSVEELALAFSALGQPQMAHDVMLAQLGNMSSDEAHARLKTAGHSLLARGWLTLDTEAQLHLTAELQRAVSALVQPDFSLRYSRSQSQGEWLSAFHFTKGMLMAHRVEQGLLHHLVEIQDPTLAIQQGIEFFELAQAVDFEIPESRLSGQFLLMLKDADPILAAQHLQTQSLPDQVKRGLLEALQLPRYRGSALRVEYDATRAAHSERGLLILGGSQQTWLFRFNGPDESSPVDILPGTPEVFAQEIQALLS